MSRCLEKSGWSACDLTKKFSKILTGNFNGSRPLSVNFTMAFQAFPVDLPKFNKYSYHVMDRCEENLLPRQFDALTTLKSWFSKEGNPGKALVSMPTGSGKTGVICCLPYFLGSIGLKPSQDHPKSLPYGDPVHNFDKPVLVIAPNNEIAGQLAGQIDVLPNEQHENFLLGRGIVPTVPNINVQKQVLPGVQNIEGTEELTYPQTLQGKDVVIANVQKFLSKKASEDSRWWVEKLPDDFFRLVVVDEAHHVPAPTWRKIVDKFRGHALVVFFTATPFRSDKKRLIEDPCCHFHLTLEEARTERIIRRTNWVPVDTQDNSDEKIFEVVLTRVKEIQERKDRENPLPNAPHMAIAITKDIELAKIAVEKWNTRWGNDSAFAYHSKLASDEQRRLMRRIRCNDVKLVVVVAKLLEGFDHPPISIAAILTNIKSPLKFVQFVGRAQRIVRSPEGQESSICADIVSHIRYQQKENYDKFDEEKFYVKPNSN